MTKNQKHVNQSILIPLIRKTALASALSQVLGFSASIGQAATITVTTTSGDTGGPDCTLRDAITAANFDTAIGGCPAGSGTDTINLPANSIITLTVRDNNDNGLPIVTSAITIEGHGATIKRDVGRPRFRIFEINQGSLELRNTIIRNGHSYNYDSGGGISSNDSIVNLINSKVLNNRTDGESNGGGIHAFGGTVTLISSTVSGNSCYANGGGIDGINTIMTIINSTISNNTGGGFGSGISNFAFPENSSSLLTLINSTVSGNNGSAGVAIYNTRMEMKNSTVTENVSSSEYTGSGIMIRKGNRGEPKEFFLENSIIANNSGRDCSNNTTLTPVVKNTLIGDGGTNCGTPFLTGDPKLKPLRKNGGPTRTHALRADSPAIDTGDDAICATLPKNTRDQPTDQRGRSRTGPAAGPHCDIGAYEFRRRRRE